MHLRATTAEKVKDKKRRRSTAEAQAHQETSTTEAEKTDLGAATSGKDENEEGTSTKEAQAQKILGARACFYQKNFPAWYVEPCIVDGAATDSYCSAKYPKSTHKSIAGKTYEVGGIFFFWQNVLVKMVTLASFGCFI